MSTWETTLNLTHQNGNLKSKPIKRNSSIIQGYNIQKRSINHLFYIDDLRLFAKDDNDLEGLLQTVSKFSDVIGMSFELDKCAKK